ncbi:putative late blight resistance protein homolog R1B-23 isoform X2 [Coffea arabica]|uniref:Late blight resistance protein homolog R1B-23 isoform X2 n=1 Tax=Coffea arabica TaxID=13443 RepID=A0ABM4V8T1_COFAR
MIMEIPSSSNANCFDFAFYDYLLSHHVSSSTSTSCFDLALDFLAKPETETLFGWHFKNLKMEIPPSSNANCFDFALYDYLQSHHISSSTSTSCFDLALDFLAKPETETLFGWHFKNLKEKVRLMKTCFLYVKKCRRRRNHEALLEHDHEGRCNIMSESLRRSIICFRIQDVAIRMILDLLPAYFQYIQSGYHLDFDIIESAITRSKEKIKLFLETDLKKSCVAIFIDYYSPGDPRLVMDLIMCLLETLDCVLPVGELRDTIRNRLKLLRHLIGFVTMQGLECSQLTDLLTYTVVAAGRLISICLSDYDDEQAVNRMESEIYQLIHEKINLHDLQVRETFVHVLTASKKQPRSSYDLALQKNEDPVVGQFIGSLRDCLMDLLGSYASFQVPVKDQILRLHEEIRCLAILLKQEEKLGDEIKDLIGVVVSDVGILTFSLFVNEIKEGLPEETDLGLFHLHKVLKYMVAEVAHNFPLKSPYSSFNYPRPNELGCMDSFLENLKELARCDEADDSIGFQQDRIQMIQKDLVFLRSFLENIKEQRYQNGKLQAFWSHVMEAAYKAELLIDLALVGDKCEDSLDAVSRDINLLKIEAPEIHNGQTQRVNKTSLHIPSQFTITMHGEDLLGLDDEVETITHRLTRGSKQLDVVPIVGMPGLGKTTLANKVYTASSVRSYFHVRGWCCVSQTYSIRSLLVELLCSIHSKSPNEYLKMDENDLAVKLRQVLLRSRYLLVLDDLWDVEAWNLLEKSLPNDANGSRILFTSRYQDLSLHFKPNSEPHHLRHLTDKESWALLQRKLFGTEDCPPALSEVRSQIAKLCQGLPLAVVLVAGILATTVQDSWEEVTKSLSSILLEDDYCKKTLELSYSHLPDYLKPCLLYFGTFQEDEVINVRRLLRLWISERFVQQTEGKSLEEAAYDYLMALINRSLVMVTRQRTVGGAKTCLLHDLVHEFCVEKAKEESFLYVIHSWKAPLSLIGPSNPHRVCVSNTGELTIWELMLIFPNLCSLILFGQDDIEHEEEDLGILLPKLLRVLDFGNLDFGSFPMEVVLLVHLRYLALKGVTYIPSAIANLSRLETLIVEDPCLGIELPSTIWNIKTLSHLRVLNYDEVWPMGFIFPLGNLEGSPDLDHLDTLDLAIDPSPQSLQKILRKLPSIRRIKCMERPREATRNCNEILEFDGLSQLESLHLFGFCGCGFKFPLNLKKLALSNNGLPWSEISTIGKLPNLEVLKLLDHSFVGEEWVMKEGEFPNLRVLKLLGLEFRNWTAFSDNFSRLEKLVLRSCEELEKVPSCLGECETLEMIEVEGCHASVVDSVKQIQQEQMDMGNVALKIEIDNYDDTIFSPEAESTPSEAEEISSEGESISSHHTIDNCESECTAGFHSSGINILCSMPELCAFTCQIC